MTTKLSQESFDALLVETHALYKRMPELTWAGAFMRVYRMKVDSSAVNPKLLATLYAPDALKIAREDYCVNY